MKRPENLMEIHRATEFYPSPRKNSHLAFCCRSRLFKTPPITPTLPTTPLYRSNPPYRATSDALLSLGKLGSSTHLSCLKLFLSKLFPDLLGSQRQERKEATRGGHSATVGYFPSPTPCPTPSSQPRRLHNFPGVSQKQKQN